MTNSTSIDAPSARGQFGWEQVGVEELAIPVITRSNDVRYSPVRIVEQEIIKKYDALPQSVFQCITLKSYYLTAAEAKLLNHINFHHANGRYGKGFFDPQNVIISASDVKDLSRFLNISLKIFTHNLGQFADKLGIIKLTVDDIGGTLLVPYICKSELPDNSSSAAPRSPLKLVAPTNDTIQSSPPPSARAQQPPPMRLIPLDMVKNFVKASAATIRTLPTDWDLMYLKMLSIYCENSHESIHKESKLVLLEGLEYIGTGTPILYEDYLGKQQPT